MQEDITVGSLLQQSELAPVIFTDFVDKVSQYKEDGVFCFVEDYDMPYYKTPVEYAFPEKHVVSIRCKGKERVLEINKYVEDIQAYQKYVKRYFVDRDFDNNIGIPRTVYITPCYSIENFYLIDRCIEGLLTTEYNIDPVSDKEIFQSLMELYHNRLDNFHDVVKLFNAWYACLHDRQDWDHKNISLDAKFPKNFYSGNFATGWVAKYTLDTIYETYPQSPIRVTQEEIDEKLNGFSANFACHFRGKYELEFLYYFINFLNEDAGRKAGKRRYMKTSKSLTVQFNTLISSIAQYAYVPKTLKEYIKTGTRD